MIGRAQPVIRLRVEKNGGNMLHRFSDHANELYLNQTLINFTNFDSELSGAESTDRPADPRRRLLRN